MTGELDGQQPGVQPPAGDGQQAKHPAPPAALWEPENPSPEPPSAPAHTRWGRLRGSLARSLATASSRPGGERDADTTDGEGSRTADSDAGRSDAPSGQSESRAGPAPDDETRPLAALVPAEPRAAAEPSLPNPLAAAWAEPGRRLWLATGAAALLAVVFLIYVGLTQGPRFMPATPAAPQAQPGEATPAEGQPPAEPAPAAPAEQPPVAQPPPAGLFGATFSQLGLAGLPLLLGLFWLLSAWLVDAEARRAFVVQEPWGERRTVAYSCLAVGCVFPLILAGLLFAAYGFVSFILFVASRQNAVAAIQAGALILLICLLFLIVRAAVARRLAERRYNPP